MLHCADSQIERLTGITHDIMTMLWSYYRGLCNINKYANVNVNLLALHPFLWHSHVEAIVSKEKKRPNV